MEHGGHDNGLECIHGGIRPVIKLVISGGQTGADRAGLEAARSAGIPTGGWASRGYLTEHGPDPTLAGFGLYESSSRNYAYRTRLNVKGSDCTLLLTAGHTVDGGSRLTADICDVLKKPIKHIVLCDSHNAQKSSIFMWLKRLYVIGHPLIVNIAGNRESKYPGLQAQATPLFFEIFDVAVEYAKPNRRNYEQRRQDVIKTIPKMSKGPNVLD